MSAIYIQFWTLFESGGVYWRKKSDEIIMRKSQEPGPVTEV